MKPGKHVICRLIAVALALAGASATASEIAPGVDYSVYNLTGPPNIVHVVRIDRLRSEYKFEVGFPQHKRNYTSRQPTSTIASLYDQPPGHDVLAAVNASFFGSGIDITGLAASRGEMLQPPYNTGHDAFFFGPSRQPAIVADVLTVPGTLTLPDGSTTSLGHYNRLNPPINNVTAYTPAWDSSTRSSFTNPSTALEVVLDDVTYPMRGDKEVAGTVLALQTGSSSQNNPIPAGGMVLTTWGAPRGQILAATQVGDVLRMRFDSSAGDYNNADFAISGIGQVVRNGAPATANWATRSAAGPYSRHPRTVLGYSADCLFMVVCDGRRTGISEGMTFAEMATFLTGTVGCTDAVNLDGGGSSTMVVDGSVRNMPSDGSERSVATAVLLVREDTATTFPFVDLFAPTGRLAGWDDKFTFNPVIDFLPLAPGGDGAVLMVSDPVGGAETTRRGDFADTDYSVQADVYCDLRPELAADGFERVGLFARDSGTGAFGLAGFGGGNCYAMTFDSDDGRIRAGKFVNGTLTDFMEQAPLYLTIGAWHRFRIDCAGTQITYVLDGEAIVSVSDSTHPRGYFGIGYHEFFANNASIRGTRADNLLAFVGNPPVAPGDFDLDGDVDLDDFAHLQNCMTGNATPQTDPLCQDARLDGDSDVDDLDLNIFLGCLSGSTVPANLACGSGH